MTTPTEDARAALTAYDRAGVDTVLTKVPAVVDALRALIEPPTETDVAAVELIDDMWEAQNAIVSTWWPRCSSGHGT